LADSEVSCRSDTLNELSYREIVNLSATAAALGRLRPEPSQSGWPGTF
jgi:hypothetical protein